MQLTDAMWKLFIAGDSDEVNLLGKEVAKPLFAAFLANLSTELLELSVNINSVKEFKQQLYQYFLDNNYPEAVAQAVTENHLASLNTTRSQLAEDGRWTFKMALIGAKYLTVEDGNARKILNGGFGSIGEAVSQRPDLMLY